MPNTIVTVIKHTVTLSALVLLGACASLQVPRARPENQFTYQPWQVREKKLMTLIDWSIKGAFSIQQNGSAHIANYEWQQRGQSYFINIRSSLNLVGAQIKGRPNKVWLYRGDKMPVIAHTPEALMQQELGYSLPISDLQFWIRGLPAIAPHTAKYDAFGHIASLKQDGWNITYDRYRPLGDVDVPRVIELSRPGLHIKIVANIWSRD